MEDHAAFLELAAEEVADFAIHHVEEGGAHVAEQHLDAQDREHRGVLDADDPGAGDDQAARQARQ